MRTKLFLSTLAVAATVVATANIYSNQSTDTRIPALNALAVSDSGVAAPAGGFWSEVQFNPAVPTVANNTIGAGCTNRLTATGEFRLADDFNVTNGLMVVTGAATYCYRSGAAGATTPITVGSFDILSGIPTSSPTTLSTSVFGNETLTVPVSAAGAAVTSGNVFRTSNTTVPAPLTPGTTRQVRQVSFPVNNLTLGPGTYWVSFSMSDTSTPTAFAPGTTHEGSRTPPVAGNALQLTATGWVAIEDTGFPATPPNIPQDTVFVLRGHVIRWDEQYNIVSGQFFGGDLDSLKADDGNILYVLCDESGPVSDIRVGFKTTISWTSSMVLRIVSGSDRTDQFERVSLELNPVGSGNWVTFDLQATTAADTEKNIVINGPANFIGPDGQVRVRVRVDPSEDLIAVDGWSNRYGLMNLRCNP